MPVEVSLGEQCTSQKQNGQELCDCVRQPNLDSRIVRDVSLLCSFEDATTDYLLGDRHVERHEPDHETAPFLLGKHLSSRRRYAQRDPLLALSSRTSKTGAAFTVGPKTSKQEMADYVDYAD